jgi:uncharacterized protein CbrC (UPF0167 family)
LGTDRDPVIAAARPNALGSFCFAAGSALAAFSATRTGPMNKALSTGTSAPSTAGAIPQLVPVRMLNEFTYCPRLAYLEWVQGEWAENLETLEGTFAHRNVDKPTTAPVAQPQGDAVESEADQAAEQKLHARSLTLSSDALTCWN